MAAKNTSAVEADRNTAANSTPARNSPPAKQTASAQDPSAGTAKKSAPARKPAPAKKPAPADTSAPAERPAPAKQVSQAEKAAATKKASAPKAAPKAANKSATKLEVREGERAWTAREIADVRATLASDAARLRIEIGAAETEIGHLLREGGEGAGNDQADVGSNTFERDHEMSMAKNARANLELVEAAVKRIDEGSYGICESCGKPIGKMRLQAFPRATLCMECKQREERR